MPTAHPLSAYTKYADLTPDQRDLVGGYVRECELVREAAAAQHEGAQQARAALKATGGDPQAALALMLAPKAPVQDRKAA